MLNKLILMVIFLSALQIQNAMSQFHRKPIELGKGPHLFIDSYLIAEQAFLSRTVNIPQRLPEPVVTGGKEGDENFQPYLSVIWDADKKRFRMWYNTAENMRQSHIGYIESEDGINWIRPHRVLKDPHKIRFGVTVLDRGPNYPDPQHRFILASYLKDGLMLATSADGLDFRAFGDTTVLKHNHDINTLHWDPIRKRYLSVFSHRLTSERWPEGPRRITHMSVSEDLLHWKKFWKIFTPKIGAPIEQGETQFYSMSGVIARGDLLIGLLKVLRDDLNATAGKSGREMGDMDRKAAGVGYTVLAWSRDGETWQRDHQPFLPNNPLPGAWDHAMTWGDEQLVVGKETFIYYGGYKRGHKIARFEERQIGLARMPRDRYVAREADLNPGTLITKRLILNANSLTVNANIIGELRIRLLGDDGNVLPGFDWVEIFGDAIDHPVNWPGDIKELAGKPVHVEFQLQDAQVFGFDLH